MPVRDGNPSQNFMRPTPAHTRPRGPSSRVGIPIRRRRNPDPAHINSNLNTAIPIPYDQALYLANYWRYVSSYLALHLLIVSNTLWLLLLLLNCHLIKDIGGTGIEIVGSKDVGLTVAYCFCC